MSGTLFALVPTAVGVAVSPIPIIELILVLFSRRRVANSIAFVLALVVLTAATVALGAAGQQAADSSGGGTSRGMALVLAAFGTGLLVLGVRNWRDRADTSEPKVFQKIVGMGPAAAAVLALGATVLNPKNLVLLLAAGQTIAASSAGSDVLVGALFVLLATAPYTLAAAYALLGGTRANDNLDRARAWLIARNRLIMGVLCILLGLLLLGKGLAAL